MHRSPNIGLFGLLMMVVAGSPASAAEEAKRPNVIVILSDDQGWGDLSSNGNNNLSTPHIDSLARDGATFDRFYVCPVCSPTRAEFLTGRYHPRGGVRGVTTGAERLDLDEKTIADAFKAAGYATGAFGKWHNGTQYPYHPNGRGFDEYYGFCSGHWGHYFNPPLEHNGKQVTGKGYITDDFTDHAISFIEANRQRPFFCYLPLNTPHSPMQVPDSFYNKFASADIKQRHDAKADEDLEMTRAALAMCENIDWNVGRLLTKLDELKLADNTIVLYFSDNGPNSFRWNGGMKGRKGSTDEGGVRSPLRMRWPAGIRPQTKIETISGAIDLLPTLAELAGVPLLKTQPLDGASFAGVLQGKGEAPLDRMIFSHWNGKTSVRTQQHRLDAAGKLYDMKADPGQTRDIAKEQPEIASKLAAAVAAWKSDVLSETRRDDRPFTVGYAEFPSAMLPARDGIAHGNIKRSAGAPNCSYYTNWTSVDDSITWDIEVATSGRYDAVVYYTCAKEDVGATIELKCGTGRCEVTVTEAHDPPPYGREQDRADRRSESSMKDFRPVKVGLMSLEKGRAELRLGALKVPGARCIEVRAVELTLVK